MRKQYKEIDNEEVGLCYNLQVLWDASNGEDERLWGCLRGRLNLSHL